MLFHITVFLNEGGICCFLGFVYVRADADRPVVFCLTCNDNGFFFFVLGEPPPRRIVYLDCLPMIVSFSFLNSPSRLSFLCCVPRCFLSFIWFSSNFPEMFAETDVPVLHVPLQLFWHSNRQCWLFISILRIIIAVSVSRVFTDMHGQTDIDLSSSFVQPRIFIIYFWSMLLI